jgi:head-tail adaptor
MRAGKLDNVISIVRETFVDDEYGNQELLSETVFANLRAQVIEANTEEFIRAWGASSESVIIFRTRWADGILLSDKVQHEGSDLRLVQIKPIGRRRGLELRCERTGL